MDGTETMLDRARKEFARGDWAAAHRDLSSARRFIDLPTEDLDRLGSASWWVGDVGTSLALSEEVFHRYEQGGDVPQAAMKAVTLGLQWYIRGNPVVASGWASRARRILADGPESLERGYLLYLEAFVGQEDGDEQHLRRAASQVSGLARRVQAPQLTALGLVLSGLADIQDGNPSAGFAQLDEAMLSVLAGQLPPAWSGDIYCTVIHTCHSLADLSRMRAWTSATEQWCQQFRGEAIYTGICEVHRFQLLSVEGHWDQVEEEIERCGAELMGRSDWAAGEAFYQLGEIRRLRGDARGAQSAFDRARLLGIEPQDGEALLLCAQGRPEEAWDRLCTALAGRDRLSSAALLRTAVDIALALGLDDEAEHLCTDLEAISEDFRTAGFHAWAAHARATLLLAHARHTEALPALQTAAAEYRAIHDRYHGAQVQELLAEAYRGLGQHGPAAAAAATARAVYRALGALPDVQRFDGRALPGGLTEREADVLALITAGASNRDTAGALVISEKTVSRHLSNIFAKIGVSSRTAAAAWAHEHGMASGR